MPELTEDNIRVTAFEVVKGSVGPYLPGERFARELTLEEAKRFLDAGVIKIVPVPKGSEPPEAPPAADPAVVFNADAQADQPKPRRAAKED